MVRYGFASQHPTTLFVYVHLLTDLTRFKAARRVSPTTSSRCRTRMDATTWV